MVWQFAVTIAALYLVGSIPTGYIAGRLLRGIDLRNWGSRATGATNSLRALGRGPFLLVLATDILKGWIPVLLIWYLSQAVGASEGRATTYKWRADWLPLWDTISQSSSVYEEDEAWQPPWEFTRLW